MTTAKPQYVDIGVNLTDDMFNGHYNGKRVHEVDLDKVLDRARNVGVVAQMVTAGSVQETNDVLTLVRQHQDLFSTAGVHPTRTEQVGEGAGFLQDLENILVREAITRNEKGKIVAIGECGLDYDRLHFASKEGQRKRFGEQLSLAIKFQLPLFLHLRSAHEDFLTILSPYLSEIAKACEKSSDTRKRIGVAHCFTGTVAEMQDLVRRGLFVGLTGCSLRSEEGIEVAKEIPLENLLLETDAPWCDMRPTHASAALLQKFASSHSDLLATYQSQTVKKEKWSSEKMVKGRNEPCCIGAVAAVIAQVKKIGLEEVARHARENTKFLFGM